MSKHETCVHGDALLPSDFLENPKLRAALAACDEPEPDPAYPNLVAWQILQREGDAFVQATPSSDARRRRGQEDDDSVEANVDGVLCENLQQDTERSEVRSHVRLWLGGLDQLANAIFRLLYEEGRSQTEAARELGVSRSTLATAHNRLLDEGRVAFA